MSEEAPVSHPFPIVQKRKWWYALSLALILPGVISLFVWGLNVGIDFRGGSLQQLHFEKDVPEIGAIREELKNTDIRGLAVQSSGSNDIIIRYPEEQGKNARERGNAILAAVKKTHPEANEVSFQNISGSVAQSTTSKATTAIIITSIILIIFIAASFSSVKAPASSWRFGVTAIMALAHDLLFMVGAFSLIGHFFPGVEVDALFITAILTVLGFSVNDTIVVFDRIRENLRRSVGLSFEEVANQSLNQTLARSINTSMTVLFVLLALLLLGGESIRNFILALTLGVAIGTYSSIFNASPLLVTWQNWVESQEQKKKALGTKQKR